MMLPRLTAVAVLALAGLACGRADAATWCVGTGSELYQALLGSSLNNESDVIRLETGTYASGLPEGFTASIAGGGLELSGGWSGGCVFRSRSARSTIDGGYLRPGLRISGSSSAPRTVRITQLAFIRGVGDEYGGLSVSGSGSGDLAVEIERCRFHDNTNTDPDDTIGGGLYVNADDVSVLGNLFTDNHAGVAGGAAGLECFSGLGAVGNNTVVGNTVAFGQATRTGGITVGGSCLWEVANNILWDNEGYDLSIPDDVATLRHNDLDDLGGVAAAGSSGNIAVDPQFVSAGILRLQRGSPLVDAGLNETFLGLPQYSYDGGIRIAGPRIDIGAYELDILLAHGFDPPFTIDDERP